MTDGVRSVVQRGIDRLMRSRIGTWIKNGTRRVGLSAFRQTRAFHFVPAIRWATWIILDEEEMRAIYEVVYEKAPCNFLVFGLGDDSPIWASTNKGGHTCFIEDDAEWIERMLERDPSLSVHHHEYDTVRRRWKHLLDAPEKLRMELPESIEERNWDVILVDAPAGYEPDQPGRMQSIYTAARLAQSGTDVFLHDIDRAVERAYGNRFLSNFDVVGEVGRLRHYKA